MFLENSRGSQASIAWITLSFRGLLLLVLLLIAGLFDQLTLAVIYLTAGWMVMTLVAGLSIARAKWPVSRYGQIAMVDILLALAIIALSGFWQSQLWWSVLIGPVSAGLALGLRRIFLLTAVGLTASVGLTLVFGEAGGGGLIPNGMGIGALMLTSAYLGWAVEQLRRVSMRFDGEQRLSVQRMRERERTIFQMAAELNATLDLQRVGDLALDLVGEVVAEGDPSESQLVSVLLLNSEDGLYVASARRLSAADRQIVLENPGGLLAEALTTGETKLCSKPSEDPVLGQFEGLADCEVVLAVPMTSILEPHGLLVFGHPNGQAFDLERMSLFEALGKQATIALQNANMYQNLEREKARMTEIQEEARRKLARDLHDGPTQTVAAITMRVNFARRLVDREPGNAVDELTRVEDMARRTTREIRHMLFTLRPLILETHGLATALHQLAGKFRETHRQNVITEADKSLDGSIDLGKQGVVFYIAEEAVNNARKHAEAEHIWVDLKKEGDQFLLQVRDDGVGFNVGAVDANYEQRGSLGIVNMRERSELVGGSLRIESSEGIGTTITLRAPLSD